MERRDLKPAHRVTTAALRPPVLPFRVRLGSNGELESVALGVAA